MKKQLSFIDNKYARLLRVALTIHEWLGKNPGWNLQHEPPWYQELRSTLVELGEEEEDPKLTRKGDWYTR